MRLLVEIDAQRSLCSCRAIGIGQSSASEHLRLLEPAAGQRLVERSGRGSRLTDAGRVLAGRAAQALAALGAGEEELAALAGLQTGTIHLGASTAPGVYLLPDTLGCFRADYPNVRVEVEVGVHRRDSRRLLAGRVQLAIVGLPSARPHRTAPVRRGRDRRRRSTRPAAGEGRPAPARLAGGRCSSAREPGSASLAVVESSLAHAAVEPAGVWELGASEAVKRAAREGLGVAFLSRFAVAEEVARGELESFRIAGVAPITRTLNVATVAGRELSPAEQGFVATLTRCCARSLSFAESCLGAPAS